jgi:hypothetical protein
MKLKRPQFHLSTLLWITLAAACWFGGMRAERWWLHDRVVKQYATTWGVGFFAEPATATQYADGREIVTVPHRNGRSVVVGVVDPKSGPIQRPNMPYK